MKTFSGKLTAGFPALLAVSLGIGLSAVVVDAAGAAGPAAAAVARPATVDPEQLKDALLAEDDLPVGYRQFDLSAVALDMMAGAGAPDEAMMTASRLAGPRSVQPVGRHYSELAADRDTTPMEIAAFRQGEDGPLLVQKLVGTGEDVAQDLVGTVENMLDCCPVITSEDMRITLSELPRMPSLGDESVATEMTFSFQGEDSDVTLHGNALVLAYGDVFEEIVLVGTPESMDDAQFTEIAKNAFHKLAYA
ncbi:hypothetical protein [Actinoplanes siamensis]|uniref:Secreted protein n=1 Tax=Actinoplanes siamensis TaxID=1223317 RepID=A0A919KAF5_9ACTN|nr:hypothetical protein [Actinoplanes siamensis]GIF02825.1 hypothetical protein Asi03nite_03630 [Actinoplanes siamensis]